MSQHPDDALVVYSDYVCPFCYLGKAAMERYREETDDPPEVEWRFYDLRGYKRGPDGSIDHDVDDGKDDDYFAQVRENVERLKDQYDVEMDLDFSKDVDSWNAQQAALYVRQTEGEETFLAFHEALFEALWQDGRNIGDPDVLAEIADELGLAPDEIRDATADETLEAELRERFESAQQAGVSGIPTFVYEGHAARGAIPPEQFERLVDGA
ncbi:DsbA family protein [Halorussus gelatinilyticus]|uniref:DsbA family protein n=1 Tax=Halorussus gelatinilyticus TaxID=2937524 RepID=A0A8U0ID26_9EURY|nr:DsbA family protein [Halorussus gelatinilyticus]UPV98852.1 DsbA family protein [Halorussus gelatinilyticus]